MSGNLFNPEGTVTRGQVGTFLWRAMGQPPAETENPFQDISEDRFYYSAVLWAVQSGITNGMEAGQFKPEDNCTRGQVVTFLHRNYG